MTIETEMTLNADGNRTVDKQWKHYHFNSTATWASCSHFYVVFI